MSLITYREAGEGQRVMQFNPHPGQARALTSEARTVFLLAGTQSGKTVTGPFWMLNEIKRKGPGDYLVATPSYPLLERKALPEMMTLFHSALKLGEYAGGSKRLYTITNPKRLFGHETDEVTRIQFGHAQDPDSLESATVKAAWLDECGQKKFRLASYEAIQRRLSVNDGRQLLTTTPYVMNWLKDLHDRAGKDDDIDLINFESRMNPAFPEAVWDRARATLPRWKFDLFYRGIFTRPAGVIYDCFDERDVITPFPIPHDWDRFVGMDFGAINTAAVFYAQHPDSGVLYAYREYYPQEKRSIRDHTAQLLAGEPGVPYAYGGAPSEEQEREEYAAAGFPVERPGISSVEVGIDRVYAAFKTHRIRVFNTLRYYLDEVRSYSRELNDRDEPTDKIEDKHAYHIMDANRYVISEVLPLEGAGETTAMISL